MTVASPSAPVVAATRAASISDRPHSTLRAGRSSSSLHVGCLCVFVLPFLTAKSIEDNTTMRDKGLQETKSQRIAERCTLRKSQSDMRPFRQMHAHQILLARSGSQTSVAIMGKKKNGVNPKI